jgi:hypothetical protein
LNILRTQRSTSRWVNESVRTRRWRVKDSSDIEEIEGVFWKDCCNILFKRQRFAMSNITL